MAKLEMTGFDGLADAFRRISEIPWDVTEEALDAMAGVAADKIRSTGQSMGVRDPQSNVHILDAITKKKAKKTDSGGSEDITFKGSRIRHGITTRNAEIAFINEYGKRNQQARPFIGEAMNKNEKEIWSQAETVIGDWIENEFKK